MAAISLKLPDDLAEESKVLAEQLGITRTEFIRQALRHEVREIKAEIERQAMAEALKAMREDPDYLQESQQLENSLGHPLPNEPDHWWRG